MVKINWASGKVKSRLYFKDLGVRQGYRNIGPRSQGAVYIKTLAPDGTYWACEVETGKLWSPTKSPVEEVDMTIDISLPKPKFYDVF